MKVIIIILGLVLLFPILPSDVSAGRDCTAQNIDFASTDYRSGVNLLNRNIERLLENYDKTEDPVSYQSQLEKQYKKFLPRIEELQSSKAQLEICNIDPNSIALLNEQAYDVVYVHAVQDEQEYDPYDHELIQKNIAIIDKASSQMEDVETTSEEVQQGKGGEGGCLIATASFGSELAPQVQLLREIRDNVVLNTATGSAFMSGFNQIYYSFSPDIADLERENPLFQQIVKITITPLITSLSLLNYVDINSEGEMLGYGIGIISLNIGMYFIAPAIVISKLVNRRK